MSQRDEKLLWLKDLLEHLSRNHQQLLWTQDMEMVRLISETMLRDLEACERICKDIKSRAETRKAI